MEVYKEDVQRDTTSCNFCTKGIHRDKQKGLEYPYKKVITFKRGNKSNGIVVSICKECLEELYQKATIEFQNNQQ